VGWVPTDDHHIVGTGAERPEEPLVLRREVWQVAIEHSPDGEEEALTGHKYLWLMKGRVGQPA